MAGAQTFKQILKAAVEEIDPDALGMSHADLEDYIYEMEGKGYQVLRNGDGTLTVLKAEVGK